MSCQAGHFRAFPSQRFEQNAARAAIAQKPKSANARLT
jgi:hypothetical protein